jgi:hypothetical protein
MSSPSNNNNGLSTSTKQVDAVTLLLKQTIAPTQFLQVKEKQGGDITKRGKKKKHFYCIS